MKRLLTILKLLCVSGLVLVSVQATAQSHDFANQPYQSDTQARLTLTVPFGAQARTQRAEPRLELGIRSYQQDTASLANTSWVLKNSEYREANFGFTLTDNPQFIVNQKVVHFNDEQANLDTISSTALITVGVGAAVIGVILLVATSGG